MVSWRAGTSQSAQDDLDGLLGPALELAQHQLDERGGFIPFAVVLDHDSEQQLVAAEGVDDASAPADLIAFLVGRITQDRDQVRAVGIVAAVHVAEIGSDAVRVTLEHSEGVALTVLLPYRRRRLGRRIDYDGPQATTATAAIWPAD